MTTLAHKIYTPDQLAAKSVNCLNAHVDFTGYDLANPDTLYDGMNRAETVRAAERERADMLGELQGRALAENLLQGVLHPEQCTICGGWPGAHIGKCPRR